MGVVLYYYVRIFFILHVNIGGVAVNGCMGGGWPFCGDPRYAAPG